MGQVCEAENAEESCGKNRNRKRSNRECSKPPPALVGCRTMSTLKHLRNNCGSQRSRERIGVLLEKFINKKPNKKPPRKANRCGRSKKKDTTKFATCTSFCKEQKKSRKKPRVCKGKKAKSGGKRKCKVESLMVSSRTKSMLKRLRDICKTQHSKDLIDQLITKFFGKSKRCK